VIGNRSSPNRNGKRALKVRARPKKVIHNRSGSSGPVASSNASRWGGTERVVAAVGVAIEQRAAGAAHRGAVAAGVPGDAQTALRDEDHPVGRHDGQVGRQRIGSPVGCRRII
jgi:hypothetical protein